MKAAVAAAHNPAYGRTQSEALLSRRPATLTRHSGVCTPVIMAVEGSSVRDVAPGTTRLCGPASTAQRPGGGAAQRPRAQAST
jgi:hypothetical protein